ncbi:MAG: SUMF1/EgtB/PvdO family nonheme iron enzyme [Gemmataceae bacterium]
MPSALVLLRCIGKAAVKNAVDLFTFGVGGDFLFDAWDYWQVATREEERTAEVQAVAQLCAAELRAEVARIVREEAAALPISKQAQIARYLGQVPAAIRRSLRRPSDPRGATTAAGAAFRKPADLLPLLPAALPRFRVGDRPPGIGDWELVELLGVGGFGEVWKARNPHFDGMPPVALKFCLDAAARERLLRHEAAVLNQVMRQGKHEGIVPLLHTYLNADPPCLAYEFVEGGDLSGFIQERRGGMSAEQAGRVIQCLAEIVGFAHRLCPPIVHRDLKPTNILLSWRSDGEPAPRITDFGIGGLAVQEAMAQSLRGRKCGEFLTAAVRGAYTPLYASPQQMRGDKPDPRDDVYALGVIWYQLLIGDSSKGRPGGEAWRKRLADRGMTPPLLALLASSYEDEREDRPANALIVAEKLETLLGENTAMSLIEPILVEKPQPAPPRSGTILENSIGMKFALVEPGVFLMGSPLREAERENDEFQHEVEITQPFHVGIYPVTQEQYERVMGVNPSWFSPTGGGQLEDLDTRQFPVERVSWQDALEFCSRLSALPEERARERIYRLPTEAEWEYVCRGGPFIKKPSPPFHFGNSLSPTQANFNGNYPYGGAAKGQYLQRTSKVASYPANPLGLFDLHGNVWEWCSDWYDAEYYQRGPRRNPQGPANGERRVLRGGSWYYGARYCRAAYRGGYAPGDRNDGGGFRVVLAVQRYSPLPCTQGREGKGSCCVAHPSPRSPLSPEYRGEGGTGWRAMTSIVPLR